MRLSLFVLSVILLLVPGAALAATLAYGTHSASGVNYRDITASDGGDTLFTLSVILSRDTPHDWWSPGEIASFQDTAWGGTAFDYSGQVPNVRSSGLFRGASWGNFTETSQTGSAYVYQTSGEFATNAPWTGVTTISAPTNVVTADGKLGYQFTITTTETLTNNTGATINIAGFGTGNKSLSVNGGGYSGWSIVNPIVDGQPYPNVHADDSSDGNQLYDLADWYGDLGGNHNDGFLIHFTVKDNAETAGLNMRPGADFEVTNAEISMNYCSRSSNNIGYTSLSSYGYLSGALNSTAREQYGGSLANGDSVSSTTTLTVTMPVVPEPTTLGLIAMGSLALLRRRRH